MADEDQSEDLVSKWTVKLEGVQRLDADDPEDDDDTYIVDLELQSPGANGSIAVMVGGGSNETAMIGQAREILQAALERWARVMASAPGVERIRPEG